MRGFIRKNRLAIIICFLLFTLPFFWMKPGEMDLGGDGNRLYYYDPKSYIVHDGLFLFDNVIEGIRTIEPHFYNIPYVLIILAAKYIVPSTYVLLSLVNGLKLSLSFLSVYLIVKTIIQHSYKEKKELLQGAPAILTGLFYAFSPIMIGNYEKALLSHNQVFLNPLIFYFLLKYFLTQKLRYMIIPIVLSLVFAPSFSWIAAPPFFAFFPLAVLFLLIYIIFIQKQKIILSHIVIGIFLFFFLHAFHLVPELYSLFNPGSYTNERVFSENNIQQQLNYFYGVLPNAKLSLNILSHSTFKQFGQFGIIVSFFVLIGFILNKPVNKTLVLTGFFFLITLYLLTANITPAGVTLYEKLFYIPGFSMFRNFIGQWAFVFSFFYALLLGQALFIIFQKIKSRYIVGLTILVSLFFILSGWNFITGRLVNKPHFQSENVKIAMTMDPSYEKMLNHIKTLKGEGAVMSFPFTDCCYSVIHGKNEGAYVGTSPITMLTGRKDYNGYIIASPFSEVLLQLAKNKDYKSLNRLLGLLHIRYIFHNSDPRVYDVTFPGYPYSSVRQYRL